MPSVKALPHLVQGEGAMTEYFILSICLIGATLFLAILAVANGYNFHGGAFKLEKPPASQEKEITRKTKE